MAIHDLGLTSCSRGPPPRVSGLQPYELGEVMLPQSVVIFVMPCVYPLLSRRFGHKGCFYVGIVAVVLFSLGVPLLCHLRDAAHRPTMWACLLSLNALRGVTGPLVFPAMIIIVNLTVTERLGFVRDRPRSPAISHDLTRSPMSSHELPLSPSISGASALRVPRPPSPWTSGF